MPVLLWDGDCAFCQRAAAFLERCAAGRLRTVPFQQVRAEFGHISEDALHRAVHLVEPDGTVRSGAAAVLAALACSGRLSHRMLWRAYSVAWFARAAEWTYRSVAARRQFAGRCARCSDTSHPAGR
jgi:predicted DCC family thiol-disulfide oxidoreductase YuxK